MTDTSTFSPIVFLEKKKKTTEANKYINTCQFNSGHIFCPFLGGNPATCIEVLRRGRLESISRKGYSSSRVKDVTETPGWFSVIQQFSHSIN